MYQTKLINTVNYMCYLQWDIKCTEGQAYAIKERGDMFGFGIFRVPIPGCIIEVGM